MKIEFDPRKDAANLKKHGLSLALARSLAWDEAYAWPDDRFDYEEWRMSALVPLENSLYYVAYVDSGETVRVISLRPADNREKKRYEREILNIA